MKTAVLLSKSIVLLVTGDNEFVNTEYVPRLNGSYFTVNSPFVGLSPKTPLLLRAHHS